MLGVRIAFVIGYIVLAPFIGALLAGIDRKISARMQGRRGPSVLQPLYDVSKLFKKEALLMNTLQFLFVATFLIFVVITGSLCFGGFDILLVFFTLTTAAMFLVLAAVSTNSPYATIGASREMIQMLSYEPMVLFTAVGFYMATGSFQLIDIVFEDIPAVVYLPGIFIGFLFILTIKLRKSPFDISGSHEAHQEIVKGITTEFSGKTLALVEIAHWYENVFLLGVVGLFCVCGKWWSYILFPVVIIAAYFLEILIDNSSARVKWQTMFRSAWLVTLAAGMINILVLQYIF